MPREAGSACRRGNRLPRLPHRMGEKQHFLAAPYVRGTTDGNICRWFERRNKIDRLRPCPWRSPLPSAYRPRLYELPCHLHVISRELRVAPCLHPRTPCLAVKFSSIDPKVRGPDRLVIGLPIPHSAEPSGRKPRAWPSRRGQ